MQLRTVQWNIGGAHIRTPNDDATNPEGYVNENLSYVIEYLKAHDPDIITLQETHADDSGSQAKAIAEQLGLKYFVNDPYDNSHIAASQKLCQSIISRYPIKEHSFELFFNPLYRKVMGDGNEWVSHDKGISTAALDIEGTELTVQTLHLIPFRVFDANVEDERGKKVRGSIEALIQKEKSPYLLQGDFNYADIPALLPAIFSNELHEVGGNISTTPKGRIYDHIFFRGMRQDSDPFVDSSVLTDHYPIVARFEI